MKVPSHSVLELPILNLGPLICYEVYLSLRVTPLISFFHEKPWLEKASLKLEIFIAEVLVKNVDVSVVLIYSIYLCKGVNIIAAVLIGRRRQWHPTPVLLTGKSHGWRSLVGCSPWGREESDTTERFHFHFSLSCGLGSGIPGMSLL